MDTYKVSMLPNDTIAIPAGHSARITLVSGMAAIMQVEQDNENESLIVIDGSMFEPKATADAQKVAALYRALSAALPHFEADTAVIAALHGGYLSR